MVRRYQRKTDRQQWSETNMALAIQEVLDGKSGYRKAARTFSVPQTTLEARVQRARRSRLDPKAAAEKGLGRYQTVFSAQQERELEAYLTFLKERLFSVTWKDIRRLAFEYAERNGVSHPFSGASRMAGKEWTTNFLRRHPHLAAKADKAAPTGAVARFLDLMAAVSARYQFQAGCVHCVVEVGVTSGPGRPSKVFSFRGSKPTIEGEAHVSAVLCANAAGNLMPPLYVFPKAVLLKEDIPLLMDGAPPGSSAYFDEGDSFLVWFKQFIDYAHPSQDRPVLLVLDGQGSHTKSLELIEMAQGNGVVLCCPPRHMQPLDPFVMGSLSSSYDEEVRNWLLEHPGQDVTVYQVGKLLGLAFTRASATGAVKVGFEKTGVYPFNLKAFAFGDLAALECADESNFQLGSYQVQPTDCDTPKHMEDQHLHYAFLVNSSITAAETLQAKADSTVPQECAGTLPYTLEIKSEVKEEIDEEMIMSDFRKQLDVQEEFQKFRKASKRRASMTERPEGVKIEKCEPQDNHHSLQNTS